MSTREFWDQRYADAAYAYGTQPNAGLVALEPRLPRGARILVPGDGEGRNSVWLAARGHQVTALDQSAVGLAKAARLAAAQGVRLHTELADLADFVPEPASVDALVLIYVHLPPEWRQAAHRRLQTALKPGGMLILEGYARAHAGLPGGGPRDPAWLYEADMLRQDFDACELAIEALDTVLDEGPCHQGAARVLRVHGRRRAA